MRNERARRGARRLTRVLTGVSTVAVMCWLPAGTAYADETNTASHNGHRVALVNVGQVDDPMEDVLEHLLLIGDGYTWN
ncbi:hypothetical protein [Streptomyces sp. ALI-76-A]|jgi:hypothetical protein|uniref:hypothetical protein n=1 Tax=Streptomyces sp. ALI-76-A TaxID=3025736 RepID=UPI00256EB647|nr:hypothetical protein [Streptomyces sp. ALI-76-A]MDL5200859.1 hypothetical protein [Streptomyces sp. ALI-76-A]